MHISGEETSIPVKRILLFHSNLKSYLEAQTVFWEPDMAGVHVTHMKLHNLMSGLRKVLS